MNLSRDQHVHRSGVNKDILCPTGVQTHTYHSENIHCSAGFLGRRAGLPRLKLVTVRHNGTTTTSSKQPNVAARSHTHIFSGQVLGRVPHPLSLSHITECIKLWKVGQGQGKCNTSLACLETGSVTWNLGHTPCSAKTAL
jgi:hypothetical protein